MQLVPNAAQDLREFNGCHAPDSGEFCSGGGGVGGRLPDDPSRYFLIDARTVLIPLAQVRTIRTRPAGIAHAEQLMRRAYDGAGQRRPPVSVRREVDGTYTVLDGNSTSTVARKHRWQRLPAHVERG